MAGVLEEVRALFRPADEVVPGGKIALLRITEAARADQIAFGVVPSSHPRLHMIDRQLIDRMNDPAVDAAVAVPAQDPASQR